MEAALLGLGVTVLFGGLTMAGVIRRRPGFCVAAFGAGLIVTALLLVVEVERSGAIIAGTVVGLLLLAGTLFFGTEKTPKFPLTLGPREIFRRSPDRSQQYLGKRIRWRVRLFRKEHIEGNRVRLTCFPVDERCIGNAIFAEVDRSEDVDLLVRDAVFILEGRIKELAPSGALVSHGKIRKAENYGRHR